MAEVESEIPEAAPMTVREKVAARLEAMKALRVYLSANFCSHAERSEEGKS